ncbi:DMT family transporter [Niallia endozanthoxylica]|uniref:Multidrug resistance efflux transporter family protein n=1 Tax=Niallia endozanthoxylica TaxID=2036016 RepID=A0A5J5I3U5_9BACI|nr:multidrug resistance efflux transporter family protein [Niallia endozanthoxylica]KAA9029986.1 multidrug resistance efflux transporter family protein [Niallia endozanthoxylica]
MRPVLYGICGAFFFAFTFILNRSMEISGGSWIWSASLRYFWTVLFLLIIVLVRKQLVPLWKIMREEPLKWLWWSSIGFGLFYAPMCFSTAYAPGWLVAATFQMTIVFGSLLAPLFYVNIETAEGIKRVRSKIPFRGLSFSLIILAGIILMQIEHAKDITGKELLFATIPMVISAIAYPLGNRKMMEVSGGRLHTFERVLGMTIASLPFWLLLSLYGLFTEGMPSSQQTVQSGMVALFAGVIATVLFFRATDLVNGEMTKLAAVEATQPVAVLFALLGELFFLSADIPSLLSWAGVLTVILGVILHSFASRKKAAKSFMLSKKAESVR